MKALFEFLMRHIVLRILILVSLIQWFIGLLFYSLIYINSDWKKPVKYLIKINQDTLDFYQTLGGDYNE